MEGTSSFAHIDAPPAGWRRLSRSVLGGLEGTASAVPSSLGCATLVFAKVDPHLVASGVFATLLAIAFVHLATARNARPFAFAGRILEATTLAAMLEQAVPQLAGWGVADSTGVRLALLCAIGASAGLVVCILYLVRADRLTPYIPAPVFAGIANSIAVTLLVSQSHSLQRLAAQAPLGALVAIAGSALATSVLLRHWKPRLPGGAAGLLAGIVVGIACAQAGSPTPLVSPEGMTLQLPVALADFHAFAAPGVSLFPLLVLVAGNAVVLGMMVFVNTAMASQALTQFDGVRPRRSDGAVTGGTLLVAGMAGGAPVSGSIMVSLAIARSAPVRAPAMVLLALFVIALYAARALSWVPLAAVVGVLLAEAWTLFDRASVRLLADWLRRRPLPDNAREDLALIVAVTLLAVVANMVVAAFGGLVLGLFLFAVRSARKPVRYVWNGQQLSSNCARGSAEMRVLAEHGATIRVFELEGDLFFAVGSTLADTLQSGSEGAGCVVLDWSRVRHIDSSLAGTVARFEQQARDHGQFVVHAGTTLQNGNVAEELARRLPAGRFTPDLDYALELAENEVIRRHGKPPSGDISAMLSVMHLFNGFTEAERQQVEAAMQQKLFHAGEVILEAGQQSDELMLVLQGCASVLAAGGSGHKVRLGGVRRGGIIGELGFLDGSPRSATVIAQEDTIVASLSRQDYERLCRSDETLVPKLLANIATALAARVRRTTQLALARGR